MKHKRNYLIEERLVGERGEEAGREVDAAVDDEQVRNADGGPLRRNHQIRCAYLPTVKKNGRFDGGLGDVALYRSLIIGRINNV